MQLRPYQEENIAEIRRHFKSGIRGILYQASTGAGKTASTSWMIARSADNGHGVWFMVHRRELIKQVRDAFNQAGIDYGVIAAGFAKNYHKPIQICMVQTVAGRLGSLKKPKLVVWDECHRIGATSYRKIYNHLNESFHIGLSATPWRSDKQGFLDFFQHMVQAPSMSWLIENGYLSRYKIFCPSQVDMSGVKMTGGDYNQKAMQEKMKQTTITGDCLKHYLAHCNGKQAIVFCYSVEHSKEVTSKFLEAGIAAAHVDGETPDKIRDQAIEDFRSGKIKVITNCNLFIEGTDIVGIEACFLLRPTKSLIVYLQSVGRALRIAPGKECAMIFDHVGIVQELGLPDDEREWTLEPRKKSARAKEAKEKALLTQICEMCYCVCKPSLMHCPNCGHEFPMQARVIEELDGELREIDVLAMRRQKTREKWQAINSASTIKELQDWAVSRGYKKGYAFYLWKMKKESKAK